MQAAHATATVSVFADEVESLTAARSSAAAGSEPSDAVRVVNALLTQVRALRCAECRGMELSSLACVQIDRLRSKQNVLILATSNVTSAIDAAFIDRADIKQFIGLPPPEARYQVLASCISELARVGLLLSEPKWLPWDEGHVLWMSIQDRLSGSAGAAAAADAAQSKATSGTAAVQGVPLWTSHMTAADVCTCLEQGGVASETLPSALQSVLLAAAAQASNGLSGRALRKLPFQAHSTHVQSVEPVGVPAMLIACIRAAIGEQVARDKLAEHTSTSMQATSR